MTTTQATRNAASERAPGNLEGWAWRGDEALGGDTGAAASASGGCAAVSVARSPGRGHGGTLGQGPQGHAAPGAEGAGSRQTPAVGTGLLRARGRLDGLLPQAQVDEPAQPDEGDGQEDQQRREAGQVAEQHEGCAHADGDEARGRHRQRRHAQRPQPRPVPDRGSIAQPERAAGARRGTAGDERDGHAVLKDAHDPGPRVAARLTARHQEVERLGDDLGAHEHGPADRTERGAVQDVVELAIGQQHEGTGHDEHHAEDRQDDDAHHELGTLVRGRTDPRGVQLPQDQAEEGTGHGTPGEREDDDTDGLVLVDVGRVEVDRQEQRHEERAGQQGDRQVAGRGHHDHDTDPRPQGQPEGVQVGTRQAGEERARQAGRGQRFLRLRGEACRPDP